MVLLRHVGGVFFEQNAGHDLAVDRDIAGHAQSFDPCLDLTGLNLTVKQAASRGRGGLFFRG